MEEIILGAVERHWKNNAMIRHSQHHFTKEKLFYWFDNCNKETHLADEGKAVDIVFLDF